MIIVATVVATILVTLGLLYLGMRVGQDLKPMSEEEPGRRNCALQWFNLRDPEEEVETT